MKLLFMIYDVDFDEDVMGMLSACHVTGYTKWDRVLGKGRESDPKLDDAIWPGFNCAILVMIEDDLEEVILKTVKELSDRLGNKGFKMFELPVLRVI